MHTRDRIKEIFDKTIESDLSYNGKIENVDYYNIFCKAAANEALYKYNGNSFCCFNYSYIKKDSVYIIFSIPLSIENENRHITERIMEVIKDVEECLIEIQYVNCVESKDDKVIYLSFIKVL